MIASTLGAVGIAAAAVEACDGWFEDIVPLLLVSGSWVAVTITVLGAPFGAVTVVVTRLGLPAMGASDGCEAVFDDDCADLDEERGVIDDCEP
jgi:hypothetical protein